MQVIEAKNLSSGDAVLFPRVGIAKVRRLAGKHSLAISAIFDDGKKRTFKAEQLVTIAEKATLISLAASGDLYRHDLESGRTSVISRIAFHSGFPDVADSFKALRGRVCEMDSVAAFAELERGALLLTEKAVYWLPVKCRACSKEAWRSPYMGMSIGGSRPQLCVSCADGMLAWLDETEEENVFSN